MGESSDGGPARPGQSARPACKVGLNIVRPVTPQGTTSPQVLVVDDDLDAREMLAELLAASGYQTRALEDGDVALAALEQGLEPSLIILDLMMPRMTGYEFLEKLRRLPPSQRAVPVIVVSAAPPESMDDVLAVFRKPTPIAELRALVERTVPRAAAPAAAR